MDSAGSDSKTRSSSLILLFVIAAAILVSSWPSTKGRFYLDSEGHFRSVPYFREPSLSWGKVYDSIFNNPLPAARRPLVTVSFLLENRLFGLSPGSARIINLVLHGLNIFLVFFLCRKLLTLLGINRDLSETAALLGALFWGMNPFHADSVLYVIQRMTVLSATFLILAALTFLKAREARPSWPWWWLLALLFLGGLTCKENAVLLPLGLVILELTIPKKEGSSADGRHHRLLILVMSITLLPLAGALILGISFSSVIQSVLQPSGREFTTAQRLLTEGRVLVHYLSQLFLPISSRLSFILKFPLSTGFFAPILTAFSWLFIGSLLGMAAVFRKRWPLIWLAVFWFFANHLMESTVIPLEIAFVHRNYLPSLFIFLPLAVWLGKHYGKTIAPTIAIALILVIFLAGWNSRAGTWGDPIRFWTDAVKKAPGSIRGYINLGVLYDIQDRSREALQVFKLGEASVFEETPARWSALFCNMGIAHMNLSQFGPAGMYMNRSLSLAELPDCLLNMAKLQLRTGEFENAHDSLDRLEAAWPLHQKLHFLRAQVYLAEGKAPEARSELQKELSLYPGNTVARDQLQKIR